jgi:hypothetical protein
VRTKLTAVAALVVVLALGVTAWVVVRADGDGDGTVEAAVERARDAHPLLLPTKIPVAWTPQTEVSRSFFSARFVAPAGDEWFQVAIAVANPPLPDTTAKVKTMSFRDDDEATYVVQGDVRTLRWSEPGSWTSHVGGQPDDLVPYEVTSAGLDEDRFFSYAESLQGVD